MKYLVRRVVVSGVHGLQFFLLWISFLLFKIFKKKSKEIKEWAVGPEEVAALVKNISSSLESSISVGLSKHLFYDYKYDYMFLPYLQNGRLQFFLRHLYSPILLGYLCNKVNGFFYVAGSGYLLTEFNGRRSEFKFLKDRGLRITCFFSGSEIRSLVLTKNLSDKLNRDMITTYQTINLTSFDLSKKESECKQLAASADLYSDFIFNASVDQISYIKRDVYPFIYFHPDSHFFKNNKKFENILKVRILHAPSSPIIKGTPLVRAAIKKLREEGYEFDYLELIRIDHSEILKHFLNTHIVLNEFYAYMPGVFGVEAMASHCALMTSADEKIETSLPVGSNSAWMVTEYWNIYDNLKRLLDDHSLIKKYADAGYLWAYENCSYQNSAIKMRNILNA